MKPKIGEIFSMVIDHQDPDIVNGGGGEVYATCTKNITRAKQTINLPRKMLDKEYIFVGHISGFEDATSCVEYKNGKIVEGHTWIIPHTCIPEIKDRIIDIRIIPPGYQVTALKYLAKTSPERQLTHRMYAEPSVKTKAYTDPSWAGKNQVHLFLNDRIPTSMMVNTAIRSGLLPAQPMCKCGASFSVDTAWGKDNTNEEPIFKCPGCANTLTISWSVKTGQARYAKYIKTQPIP